MNFKNSLKKVYNTLSFTIFSIQTLLFILFYFLREREGERERESKILEEKTILRNLMFS